MSMSFDKPMNAEAKSLIEETFNEGQITVMDEMNVLFSAEKEKIIDQQEMKKIANAAKQPVKIELHGEGEIKTMYDGTKYRVTKEGWKKIIE